MKIYKTIPALALLVACNNNQDGQPDETTTGTESVHTDYTAIAVEYTDSKRIDSIVDYHGTEINDPFRWMEDQNAEDVADWVDRQIAVTEGYLSQIPFRQAINDRLTEIWDYEKMGAPWNEGDYVFFYKNSGTQNHYVLYQKDNEDATEKVFIDPNTLSEDGTTALTGFSVSKNQKYAGYGLSTAGSDWVTIYVKDMQTGEDLEDKIEWGKFTGIDWLGDDGFFYSRYDKPTDAAYSDRNVFQKAYYHKIGTPQSEDILIMKDDDHEDYGWGVSVSDDEQWVFLSTWQSTSGNRLAFIPVIGNMEFTDRNNSPEFIPIVDDFSSDTWVFDTDENGFLAMTNRDAPNYRIVRINPENPTPENWEDIVAESDHLLEGASVVNNQLVLQYLKDVSTTVEIRAKDGSMINTVELPGIGIARGISGEKENDYFYYSFTNFTTPSSIYKYDFNSKSSEVYWTPEIDFDFTAYETKQVWYESKDGTKVPMFITHKKDLIIDGSNPTLIYGYGGFNISIKPGFSVSKAILLENNGIYCVANIRGGGEFGKKWHQAGTKEQKQNVFNDFIAAGEYMIAEGYTNSDKLAIQGGSNGGLLVAACMTQRPDLYAVCIPEVGVLDMLQFHNFTIGEAWCDDYGNSDYPEDFEYLIKYSPVHNVKDVAYPATMITTGDHDDRVVPAHSFKFAAQLQLHQQGENPVLIRIDKSAGHGAGKPVSKQIAEEADIWAFMFYNLNMECVYMR